MPLERYFKLPHDKRDRLLGAARGEFAEHGFEQASYNRIIEQAGVSKGAMYYYFADKADLFGEVVGQVMEGLAHKVGRPAPADDAEGFWRSLEEWMARANQVLLEEPDMASLGRSFWNAAGAERAVARVRQQTLEVVSGLLREGQALGAVRSDVPLDMLAAALTHLLLGLDRWCAELLEQNGTDAGTLERLGEHTIALCRDLVQGRQGRAA